MTCNCNGTSCGCKQESSADNKTPINGLFNVSNNIPPFNFDSGINIASTSTYEISMYHPKTVVDCVVDDETITITYVQRAKYSYTTYCLNVTISNSQVSVHNPDLVFKEVYGVRDGKLTLLKTIKGRIVPPQLEESFEFDEE